MLFNAHRTEMSDVLSTFYPDYPWQATRFVDSSGRKHYGSGQWQNKTNLMKALSRAEKTLMIEKVCPLPQSLAYWALTVSSPTPLFVARRLVFSTGCRFEGSRELSFLHHHFEAR